MKKSAVIKRRQIAEWEKQQGILLCWPYNKTDWPGKFDAIHFVYQEIIKAITPTEKVYLIVQSLSHKTFVFGLLKKCPIDLKQIEFIIQKTDRSWMRDTSPFFVEESGSLGAYSFSFNGWAKYPNYKLDQKVPKTISSPLQIPLTPVLYNDKPVVLEGGAVDVNGKGSMLATEECLLDKKQQIRNAGFTKKDYQNVFQKYLGITNIIWLNKGILGDDTHGHVDDLCRFINPTTVVLASEKNPKNPHYRILKENEERLQSAMLENGKKINVVLLPMPKAVIYEKTLLPASYANFLILNQAVLVPTFNDENDSLVLDLFKNLFPGRRIIGIHAVDLVWGLGTLHCLSHEIPQI